MIKLFFLLINFTLGQHNIFNALNALINEVITLAMRYSIHRYSIIYTEIKY